MSTPPTPTNLTAKEQRRLERLRDLKRKLEHGEHVQNRTLETWLGADAVEEMKQQWDIQLETRAELKDKPPEIVEYERRLKRANFAYAKAEGASLRSKRNAKKLYDKCEHEYENLREYLEETLDIDPSLSVWFDRSPEISFNKPGTGIEFHCMPRVITSRSMENQSDGTMYGNHRTKRDIKIEAVDQAISALENKLTEGQEANQATKLKDMLKQIKKQ
jgi:hypothetical protein